MAPKKTSGWILLAGGAVLAGFLWGAFPACRNSRRPKNPNVEPSQSSRTRPAPNAPPAASRSDSDYQRHIDALKKKNYRLGKLTYLVEKPFVVVGNESPAQVRYRARETVRWAVRMLKKDYFPKDPKEIITIWLLGDKTTYQSACRKLTGSAPGTPFGFYTSTYQALIMNISTGGGTLVHEIVHPFMDANFPKCPPWLNEGLASLYEQCGTRDGKIIGHTNWRLAGLQQAIRAKTTLPFRDLCALSETKFRNNDVRGNFYAQSRYLCYWLQERQLLRKFYHAFHAAQTQDPTGYKTLVETLGRPEMEKFRAQWETWCMDLRFP